MPRWIKPPKRAYGPAFELWADTMHRRGFSAWQIACRAAVSETHVTNAINRYRAMREYYGGDANAKRG